MTTAVLAVTGDPRVHAAKGDVDARITAVNGRQLHPAAHIPTQGSGKGVEIQI